MTARPTPWRRSGRLAVGLSVVGLILAGCVNLPSGGAIRNVNPLRISNLGSQDVITPRPPGPLWQPRDIVAGFLAASGADPDNLSIAKDYLTPTFANAWDPQKASPNVIETHFKVTPTSIPPRLTGGQTSFQVTVTSQHLESLVAAGAPEAGRLQVAEGPAPYVFTFGVIQFDGKWRIDSISGLNGKPSDSILLLTESDFERDYLPRNLYYLDRASPHTLVPYPVYIPAQTGQLGGVTQLVEAVRSLPPPGSNWLYHAIETTLRRTNPTVEVLGSTAVVKLGGAAARADSATVSAMAAQLVWTLTYAPDSPGGTGINSVDLDVGGRSFTNLTRSQPSLTSWLPQGPSGPLYYQTLDQTGRPLLEGFTPSSRFGSLATDKADGDGRIRGVVVGGPPAPEPLPGGLGHGPFSAAAVAPATSLGVNYFAVCHGTKAYVAPLLEITDVESRDLPGKCTSLSWDNQGDCLAIAGSDPYVLNATLSGLQVNPVIIPTQQIGPSDNFVSLKVAPDGIRVAMIVRGKNGARVYVSAITKKRTGPNSQTVYLAEGGSMLTVGPNLVDPIALAWRDSDHLLVLDRQHGVSQLYEVPLHGGTPSPVVTPRDATSVTSDGSFIAVGTPVSGTRSRAGVLVSRGFDGPWIRIAQGTAPTYAG